MSKPSHPRAISPADRKAQIRPGVAAATFGAVVGLAIGCAWLGGAAAKATTVRAQAERIDSATAAGFTEEALAAAAGGLDESALAIARRHDPYTVAGSAQRDRQSALLTARLEQLRGQSSDSGLRQVSLTGPLAAQPFRLGGALDASRDLECLTQAAYYEARGEGRDGMRAVAQVVLNRARHRAFPNSVCGVVFQGAGRRTGCQFSFTCNGSMRGPVNRAAWNRARDVASAALSGAVEARVGNATHFHTTGVSPRWRHSLVRVSQVGDHLFYRFGGRSGSGAAFTYAARPSTDADVSAPQLVQASLDPSGAVRDAGAIAYNLLLAQEGRTPSAPAEAAAATPAPAAPAATTPTSPAPAAKVAQPVGASASVATPASATPSA
ncbi:cell wall hydrolase [Brevundimonas basaltis]|uniref:Spore germination cell wall hydrolase CwlJ-like protein n=1 Tax=Brevundimonas basaltis TaxID=472166 RepID=A0A7W8I058_9CAUL|nr:cell wall hydrolase [Brevundimonas basaltis]MBB5292298.1 spore germination cell wall hydrolase CwlJ-like protein [Brevundimonas basaltis]